MDHRNKVAEAFENTIEGAHLRAKVTAALALWETWIVVASVLYLIGRFWPWAQGGFQVVVR